MTSSIGRRATWAVLGLVVAAGILQSSPIQAGPKIKPGTFTQHVYPAPGVPGAREYWLYLPARRSIERKRLPLVVYLHGCLQTAQEAAAQTRYNDLADLHRFAVVYPQQRVPNGSSYPLADGNGSGCWNWFIPDHQQRDAGEPATIAGITRHVIATQRIDRDRVYVEGVSAGADMAVIMGATHPDLYAAVGAVAGCPYATCGDVTGELAYRAMGERARVVPAFVAQGTADNLNVYALGAALVQQWLGTSDLADDGQPNGSISRTPSETETHEADQSPEPGSGDPCIRSQNWPCPGGVIGFQESYPYTIQRYEDSRGCGLVEFWSIHGLAHGYPNADPSIHWSDPLGPDITTAAYEFFSQHTLSGPCT